ncbi:MAG: hypothetical protein JWM05_2065 [Acidimicrobiales bacterium]|nr:hypothetical protein [Acidimicrobiales bacterium]
MQPHPPTSPTVPRRGSGAAGFTILELGLVVAVLLVLTGIVMAATGGIRGRGREIDCHDELRRVKVAVANYVSVVNLNPKGTAVLTRQKDPVRGGRYLNATPRWYAVQPNGVIVRLPGAPASCPKT